MKEHNTASGQGSMAVEDKGDLADMAADRAVV
jgi:hypothetical protein